LDVLECRVLAKVSDEQVQEDVRHLKKWTDALNPASEMLLNGDPYTLNSRERYSKGLFEITMLSSANRGEPVGLLFLDFQSKIRTAQIEDLSNFLTAISGRISFSQGILTLNSAVNCDRNDSETRTDSDHATPSLFLPILRCRFQSPIQQSVICRRLVSSNQNHFVKLSPSQEFIFSRNSEARYWHHLTRYQ
jgi:hypothetical protein